MTEDRDSPTTVLLSLTVMTPLVCTDVSLLMLTTTYVRAALAASISRQKASNTPPMIKPHFSCFFAAGPECGRTTDVSRQAVANRLHPPEATSSRARGAAMQARHCCMLNAVCCL